MLLYVPTNKMLSTHDPGDLFLSNIRIHNVSPAKQNREAIENSIIKS